MKNHKRSVAFDVQKKNLLNSIDTYHGCQCWGWRMATMTMTKDVAAAAAPDDDGGGGGK